MLLAPYHHPLINNSSPSWIAFASKQMHDWLANDQKMEIGHVDKDHTILFIGETSPGIHSMVARGKVFSIFMLQPDISHLSDNVLRLVDRLYVVNHHHLSIIEKLLQERLPDHQIKLRVWQYFPKTFAPPIRHKKLYGILEPDYNTNNFGDNLFSALNSYASKNDYNFAFYTLNVDTFERLTKTTNNIPVYHLDSPEDSPFVNLAHMPNAWLSIDSQKYNPILSTLAQTSIVSRPYWAGTSVAQTLSNNLMTPTRTVDTIENIISNFVNKIYKIEELEVSKSISDQLLRNELLGDFYGDYTKSK